MVDGYNVYANNGDTFYEALSVFTGDGENARFESALSFDDNGEIEASGCLLKTAMIGMRGMMLSMKPA